jgi:hypothetical protein
MTEKNLLLQDLCARLPYGVKISVNDRVEVLQGVNVLDNVVEYCSCLSCGIEEVKPYLFPLSSMNEEEWTEYEDMCDSFRGEEFCELIDWFNENHFDYRRLIEKGLAIDATGKNIY